MIWGAVLECIARALRMLAALAELRGDWSARAQQRRTEAMAARDKVPLRGRRPPAAISSGRRLRITISIAHSPTGVRVWSSGGRLYR